MDKRAAAALFNEGLSHLVLARVSEATSLIERTSKTGSLIARKDLHTITQRVASLVEAHDLSSGELHTGLLDLKKKAEAIYDHFNPKASK